jgi:K+ transporter
LLLAFALVGAVWLAPGSLFYLLGSSLRAALKVDRHASGLFQTIMFLLKPLVLFYAVAFIAIQFWPQAAFTQIVGVLFGVAVLTFWFAIFFGGLLSTPDEALG